MTFFDVETTGLNTSDRIITLAAIKLLNPETCATRIEAEFMHLIFDPGRKSHPKAEAVHGYSDWVLRHQDTFDVHAETIQKFFNSSDLLVAHNAEFDLAFYNREMERTGRSPFANETFCTMTAFRQRGLPGSASLGAVCHRMGIARASGQHGALEDTWLALRVYLWLKNVPFSAPLPPEFQKGPSNLRPAPQLPVGPLPRRRRKRTASPSAVIGELGDGSTVI
ncbi:exonuclease domain-containing protein [Bradyrhizobium sp. LLZ17]|uniref:Exonuclease domain-containing protein n=1 Tax=Bradyrhizobium sp. LLZ17 TaxID=3239388 RepID=A0AB39XFV9_9BRAD